MTSDRKKPGVAFWATLMLIQPFFIVGCGDLEAFPNANAAFHATFGKDPPTDVTALLGVGRAFRDSGNCYLRFNAPFPTVESLSGATFSEITSTTFATKSFSYPVPPWWPPPVTPTTKFYSSTAFHPSFSHGDAVMTYDTATEVAYFYWDGWD